jgi:hypothetical protein
LDGNVECRPGEGIDDTCTINPMYPLSTAIVEWKLKAKDVNVKTNCELGIYVEYAYTTHSTSSVTFVNKEEAEQWVLQGRNLDEAGSKVIGEGPVKSYVEVKSQPIMVNRGVSGEASGSAIMTFWIENKGDGMLKEGKLPLEQLTISSAEEKITTSSGPIKKCIKEKAGNQPIIFIDKKSPVYSCEIYLKDTNEVKIEKTYEITSDLTDYTYRFTKKKTVTVKPQIEV